MPKRQRPEQDYSWWVQMKYYPAIAGYIVLPFSAVTFAGSQGVGCLAQRFGRAFAKTKFGGGLKINIYLGTAVAGMGYEIWQVMCDNDNEQGESVRTHLVHQPEPSEDGGDGATATEADADTTTDDDPPSACLFLLSSLVTHSTGSTAMYIVGRPP